MIFISTNTDASIVRKAHILSVQGYFEKPATINGITAMLKKVFEYWKLCKHINNV
jgi:hypothetical protein